MSGSQVTERYLQDIVPFLQLDECWKKIIVTGLAVDSRRVKAGNCFLGYPGHHSDGRDFLSSALVAGAGSALVEAEGFERHSGVAANASVPVVAIPGLKKHLGHIASEFYGNPSTQLKLLAITGTNGKTSVSQLTAQALDQLGVCCGVVGTLGNGIVGHLEPTLNTTPDVVECNRLLAEMRAAGADAATMEVSSHGLVQGRVDGVTIHSGLITNISRDHLDYHGTMEAYAQAKAQLALHPGLRHLVLNWDDERVAAMVSARQEGTRLWSFSMQNRDDVTVRVLSVHYDKQGIDLTVGYGPQHTSIRSPLIGEFNAANLVACITLLLTLDVDLEQAAAALSTLGPVEGRMQRVEAEASQPMVIIDFAHTPDALEKVLLTLKRHAGGRIWCVFGCGGDRDAGKRPLMAGVVADLADELVITADNPRSETFVGIVADMVKGIPAAVAFQVMEDRTQAVAYAIAHAQANDVVLIAGKGHENYQEIAGNKHPYSDLAAAQAALNAAVAVGAPDGEDR
ncbi:MAG: UDP-N-acetylmuramoyl-L-alanyl-D-glutamate--2,6-diaminopimelate ligase [Pseudomonadota bacterium]|nr:UDP-N-acetylmuramoyl-L-alanyl-D-glutamate--2,6-diaminopimelate ligase [Pseudomonadota bacterium]